MGLVAGVDCSTQSVKVLVVDTQSGRIVARGSATHDVHGINGARETDPHAWEVSLRRAILTTDCAEQIDAVAVAAQQHSLVVVDEHARPLRDALLWNDVRSAADATRLIELLGGPYATVQEIGSVPTAAFTVAHWMWLRRNEPDVAKRTRGVLLPHDYLNHILTNRATTDRSDVSATGWWSTKSESYSERVLSLPDVDLPIDMLPVVVAHDDAAGYVSPHGAEATGLRIGIPVGTGAGDNAAGALSLALHPGEFAMSLGTSGTTFAVVDAPSFDDSGIVAGFASADGRYLPLACTLNATLAIDHVAQLLSLDREDVEHSHDVVMLPWFGGERTPNRPEATGTVSGVTYQTTPQQILLAAYEGVVATLLEAAKELAKWSTQSEDLPIVLLGGGAKGITWQDTVRRLSGRPVLVVDVDEPVAYGAAMQAAALLENGNLTELGRRWNSRSGCLLEPLEKDTVTLQKIAAWRDSICTV